MFFTNFAIMRLCSSKKITYGSYSAAVTALIEARRKSNYSIGEGPQNVYQCHICEQYHLTSRGPMHKELQQSGSSLSQRTQNAVNRWLEKNKEY